MRERNYICKGRWRQNSAGEWMQHQDGQTLVVFLSGGKYVWRVIRTNGVESRVEDTFEAAKASAEQFAKPEQVT